MEILHNIAMIAQFFVAFALIAVVMSQTNKDQGMGGALSGQNADASRYKGGYEEKMDNLAKNLAFWFLGLSFAVAVFAHLAG
ncbi:MAG TPA: preprotein translocase subunit SecG [Armatimonadota bacterium]